MKKENRKENIFISHFSCLVMASYEPALSPDARLKMVEEAAELFGGAFVTLDSVAGDPPIDSTISHLGELQQI